MDLSKLYPNWDTIKGQLKQRYAQLTDDDLTFIEGKGEELFGRLQAKLGMGREDLQAQLDELSGEAGELVEEATAKTEEFSGEVRSRAEALAGDLKEKAAALGEEAKVQGAAAYGAAREGVLDLLTEGEECVRRKPREALLTALAAGFVIGLLLRR